jgi:hypothetical protein
MFIRFLIMCLFCVALQADEFLDKRLAELDQRIEALEEKKAYLEKSASIHLNRAHRFQSNKDMSLDTRKEYSLAEQDQDQARNVERQIKKLQDEKKELQGRG